MIVILEGVDGSGKTTLCKQLMEKGYKQLCVAGGGEGEFYAWRRAKEHFVESVAISDRSFITDIAYRLYDFKPRRCMCLESMLETLKHDVKIVFLESGTEYTDSIQRGENNITTKYANTKIKQNYRIIADILEMFSSVPIMRYDWRIQDVTDVINFINEGKEENNGVR